jgi:hypothetical protein
VITESSALAGEQLHRNLLDDVINRGAVFAAGLIEDEPVA